MPPRKGISSPRPPTPPTPEPQISVPMIDVMAALPGATPAEVENLIVRPIERRMYEISGVDHVYSTAADGFALVTVRFRVGENQEQSVVKGSRQVVLGDGPGSPRGDAAARQAALDRRRADPGAHPALPGVRIG